MGNQEKDICTLRSFERNKYFYGKLLSVRDFEVEQSYFRGKDALINRLIHSGGIVCGLETKVVDGSVVISRGVAIDYCGREIMLSESTSREVGDFPDAVNYVYLEYDQCYEEKAPCIVQGSTCEEKCDYNRVKEGFHVDVSPEPPYAGKSTVSGTVECDGNAPIQSAIIEAVESQGGIVRGLAITDKNGQYGLLVKPGEYTIRASASGFVTSEHEDVDVPENGQVTENFTLEAVSETPAPMPPEELAQEYYEKYLKTCPECSEQDARVFLAAVTKSEDGSLSVDHDADKHRIIIPNSPMLYRLLGIHIADFNNPHYTTAEQVKALKSINNVGNVEDAETYVSNVNLVSPDNTVGIDPVAPENDDPKINIKIIPAGGDDIQSVNTAKGAGTLSNFARGDHVHDLAQGVVTEDKIDDGAVTGPKIDRTALQPGYGIAITDPGGGNFKFFADLENNADNIESVGTPKSAGSSTYLARANHVHDLGSGVVKNDHVSDDDADRIVESKIAFDTQAGHDHDGLNSKKVDALVSVDGVKGDPDNGNVDLGSPDGSITISPDIGANQIELTTSAAQVGAIGSIEIVHPDGAPADTVKPDKDGNIELVEGENVTIEPTPDTTNSLTISATGGTGYEADLTRLKIDNWTHGGTMTLGQFMARVTGNGLRVEFIRAGAPSEVRLGDTPNEVFLVAVKTPLLYWDNMVKTYHYEYLPGDVRSEDDRTAAIFRLDSPNIDSYRDYLQQILRSEGQLTVLAQLKCDFIRDIRYDEQEQEVVGKAVDGSHATRIGASGLIWDDGNYLGGIRGRVFESWFSIFLEPTVDPDLVVSYSFDTFIDGDVVPDDSGKGHDAEIVGDVIPTDGVHDGGAYFTNEGYLNLKGEEFPTSDIPVDAITLCAWIRVDEPTGAEHAIFNAGGSETLAVWSGLYGEGQFRWALGSDSGEPIFDIRYGQWDVGEWVHFAGVYSEAQGLATLYVNGEQVASVDAGGKIADDWGLGARIGRGVNDENLFTGSMDDFCIYKRALAQDEIMQVMESGPLAMAVVSPELPVIDVSGVGPSTNTALNSLGIATVGDLANSTVDALRAGGISESRARGIIAEAKRMLGGD